MNAIDWDIDPRLAIRAIRSWRRLYLDTFEVRKVRQFPGYWNWRRTHFKGCRRQRLNNVRTSQIDVRWYVTGVATDAELQFVRGWAR